MRRILLSSLAALTLISALALATGSLSITSVTIPSSATVGDTFTLTVQISGTEIQGSQATGSLTLPSGITCTPTSSQTINLVSDVGSTSWTCSANAAGDYSNQITASVTATDSGTLASLSSSRQTGLNVLSPASLTSSSAISSATVNVDSSVTMTVGVNNIGGASATYNISLSCPSGLACSPSSVSTTTIDGLTLENNGFTVTGNAAGSYVITANVYGNDQTLTVEQSLTVNATTIQTPAGSSGGGGGGGSSSPQTKVTLSRGNANITVPSIAAEKMSNVSISKTEDMAFRQINITVSNSVKNIKIVITKIAALPAYVTKEIYGKTYHYIEIGKENITDSDISKIDIKFAVNKSWLTANNLNAANVTLYRWSGSSWADLNAVRSGEDSTEVFFNVNSPGLSVFVIGVKGTVQLTPTPTPTPTPSQMTPTPTPTGPAATTLSPAPSGDSSGFMYVIVIVVILAAASIAIFLNRKKIMAHPHAAKIAAHVRRSSVERRKSEEVYSGNKMRVDTENFE